ncbi:MAG: hypothetical protein WBE92_07650 [Steroidobacteraceae bacterium]
MDAAKRFLKYVLAVRPVAAADVFRQAEQADIAEKTVRRAKKALGITTVKAGMDGGWVWSLPKRVNAPEDGQPEIVANFEGS